MKTKTKEVVAAMLMENTGRHMLDSGGAYGRSWEKNQDRDFTSEPRFKAEFNITKEGGLIIGVSKNVYHHMVETLEFDPDMQAVYDKFVKDSEDSHFEDVHKFLEGSNLYDWLRQKSGPKPIYEQQLLGALMDNGSFGGMYSEGEPSTTNTYNGECILSQTLQFAIMSLPDMPTWALVQVHGGCDVRGGYTAPKIFHMEDDFLLYNDATISSAEAPSEHYWRTEDGYHWYYQGVCAADAGKQLEKYSAACLQEIMEDTAAGQAVADIDKAIRLGRDQVGEMLKRFPDRQEKFLQEHKASCERFSKERKEIQKQFIHEYAQTQQEGVVLVDEVTDEAWCPITGAELIIG